FSKGASAVCQHASSARRASDAARRSVRRTTSAAAAISATGPVPTYSRTTRPATFLERVEKRQRPCTSQPIAVCYLSHHEPLGAGPAVAFNLPGTAGPPALVTFYHGAATARQIEASANLSPAAGTTMAPASCSRQPGLAVSGTFRLSGSSPGPRPRR